MTVDGLLNNTADDLEFITIEFLQHSNSKHCNAHHKLDTQHGGAIEIDDAVEAILDPKDPNDKSDISAVLLPKVVEEMELGSDDAAKVTQMFHSGAMVFKWMLHKNDGFC